MLIENFNRIHYKKNSQKRRINIKTFPAQMFKAAIYPYKKQNNMTIDYMPNFQRSQILRLF